MARLGNLIAIFLVRPAPQGSHSTLLVLPKGKVPRPPW